MKPFHEELKALRIEKGVSLEDIYQITKIRPTILEKLEEGDFTIVPEPFLHAFLREYAEAAGIDPGRVIARYEKRTDSIVKEAPAEERKPESKPSAAETAAVEPKLGSARAAEPETTAKITVKPPAAPPLQVKFIDDEKTEKQPESPRGEEGNEPVSGFSRAGRSIEEPRSSQGLLLGIFIVVIIIAALVIMYVTGGIH